MYIGWLEPLLHRIGQNYSNVVVPVIDSIADDTLELTWLNGDQIQIGNFDWNLVFNWMVIPSYIAKTRSSKVEPIRLVSQWFNWLFLPSSALNGFVD